MVSAATILSEKKLLQKCSLKIFEYRAWTVAKAGLSSCPVIRSINAKMKKRNGATDRTSFSHGHSRFTAAKVKNRLAKTIFVLMKSLLQALGLQTFRVTQRKDYCI